MKRVAAIILLASFSIGAAGDCDGNMPNGPDPQNGACCLPGGSCLDTTEEDCSTMSGAFNADQACTDVNCPPPPPATGACCLPDGSCLDTTTDDCSTMTGAFNTDQACTDVSCPPPPPANGACCLIDGTCRDSDEIDCAARSGTFNEGQGCNDVTCAAPSLQDIRNLAQDLESILREDLKDYIHTVGIVGREYWNLNGDDPRYTGELLGRLGASPAPDSPLTTRTFLARYKAVRHAETLMTAVQNTSASLTQEQQNAIRGYAKTIQAYALLLVFNHQFTNGILPVGSLDDPDPANFLDFTGSLQNIADLLDEAATLLTNGGSSFVFNLSAGFAGFTTPATFRQVNRALSARVRIYQGDKAGAISGIAGSFFNINGSMSTGPKHSYSIETRNPMFHHPDEDLFTVHPTFISNAIAGDLRVSQKTRAYIPTAEFFVPVALEGLVGDRQVNVVALDTDPFPIIRNEELILIYAEAQIGSNVNEVLAAINRVRNAAGLGNYLGATDDASLLNEVLKQRRYSLFGEGHRWIDLRRTGKLGQVPIDRVGDVVHTEFPRPAQATLDEI